MKAIKMPTAKICRSNDRLVVMVPLGGSSVVPSSFMVVVKWQQRRQQWNEEPNKRSSDTV